MNSKSVRHYTVTTILILSAIPGKNILQQVTQELGATIRQQLHNILTSCTLCPLAYNTFGQAAHLPTQVSVKVNKTNISFI
jgi:hypothetical protein